jgi:hypothetical protein
LLLALLAAIGASLGAQIMPAKDMPMPEATEQGSGELVPYFWIGGQAVGTFGINLETGAFGIKEANSSDTWASFNFALVDSRYNPPKFFEAAKKGDNWTGNVYLRNFSYRMNSWETSPEINKPVWGASIKGHGLRFGFFTQAGELIIDPATKIESGKQVLYFANPDVQVTDFLTASNPYTTASYTGKALLYGGYEQKDFLKAFVTLTTEGTADTPLVGGQNTNANGMAGVLDFAFTPLGVAPTKDKPFALAATGNVLGGFGFSANPLGFGIKLEPSLYLGQDLALSPVAAFDAMLPEGGTLRWAVGGGLLFRFSALKFGADVWGERGASLSAYFDKTYERDGIYRAAYAQLYASYSENDDLDIALKAEEPEGELGFHPQLGAMLEFRVNNLLQSTGNQRGWSGIARASYDLMEGRLIPGIRAYMNNQGVLRLRAGVQFSPFPYSGFELAYMSPNLNPGTTSTAPADAFNAGKIELTVVVKSDSGIIHTPRKASDWWK